MKTEGRYACTCGRMIQEEYVESVLPGGRGPGGEAVIVHYRCTCDPSTDHVKRFPLIWEALLAITDRKGVPYRNRCPLRPVPADSPEMKEWREFIGRHGHDCEAFLTALNQ